MTQLGERFQEAFQMAARLHANQVRKGSGIPYLAHLLAVAALVLEFGGSEDTAIAALLHDAIEDQGATFAGGPSALRADIERRFGAPVLAIIEGCTDADTLPKPPWRERKEAYLRHLASAPADVLLVSGADKLHNARAILRDYRVHGDALWRRFNGGRSGTLWYYQSLLAAYRDSGGQPDLVAEFARTLDEINALAAGNE